MSQYGPTWGYGGSKLFNSSGSTVVDGDDIWVYGEDNLVHEYVAPSPGVADDQIFFGMNF